MNMFNKFIKSVEENDIFTLFETVIKNNVNISFLILTREFLLIF